MDLSDAIETNRDKRNRRSGGDRHTARLSNILARFVRSYWKTLRRLLAALLPALFACDVILASRDHAWLTQGWSIPFELLAILAFALLLIPIEYLKLSSHRHA